jgi:membrane-bound metal-dependent hydrolase YbcI (DUF457 family)
MFIGHYAPALIAAAHPKAPRLGTLFVAAQLVDFGFFTLLLTGAEKMRVSPGISAMNPMDLYHMPYTHSLAGSLVWAAAFALIIRAWLKSWTPALIAGAVVVSHWFVDLIVHTPDLTLFGSAPKFGLGLWNQPGIAMPLELFMTFGALWFYTERVAPKKASAALPLLIIFLFAVQLYNWFGPAPKAVDAALSISALAAYSLATLLAWWVAKARVARPVS